MTTVLDQVDDRSHRDLHTFAKLYVLPDYVKTASTEQVCNPQDLASTAYADPQRRKFPCHTKAAALVSCLFFMEKHADMNPKLAKFVGQRLDKFATHWGVQNDVAELRKKHAELHANGIDRLPDSSFAIVWAGDDGSKDRRYPLRNATEVKAAAHWLEENRDHFYFTDRQHIAQKILDKVAEFGTCLGDDLDDTMEKMAGRGVYDPCKVAGLLRDRVLAVAAVKPEVEERMLKLAQAVEDNPALAEDPTSSSQLCATVDQFDREHHLLGKYSAAIPRPEDVIFAGMLKAAGEFVKNACVMVTGSIYDRGQFGSLSPSAVRDVLGGDIAQAVTSGLHVDPEKMAEVAATLPVPDAQTLDRLMAEVGQAPIRKEATARGVPADETEKLARTYEFLNQLPDPRNGFTTVEPTGVTGSRVVGAGA